MSNCELSSCTRFHSSSAAHAFLNTPVQRKSWCGCVWWLLWPRAHNKKEGSPFTSIPVWYYERLAATSQLSPHTGMKGRRRKGEKKGKKKREEKKEEKKERSPLTTIPEWSPTSVLSDLAAA